LNFDQQFEIVDGQPCDEACRESGVGHEIGLAFLYEQAVEGHLMSCLNCGHPLVIWAETVTYSFNWPGLPAVVPVSEPPPPVTTVQVLP
jgi:hypothetical protein